MKIPEYSEKTRTIILVLLLIAGIIFLVWSNRQYNSNFTDNF